MGHLEVPGRAWRLCIRIFHSARAHSTPRVASARSLNRFLLVLKCVGRNCRRREQPPHSLGEV